MSGPVDLSGVPVVDDHCHGLQDSRDLRAPDPERWRALFTESTDPGMRAHDAGQTVFYRRLLRAMAAFHGVDATEEDVLAARARHTPAELAGLLFHDAGIEGVVDDTGYPEPGTAMAPEAFTAATGAQRVALLRLEPALEALVAEHAAFDDLLDAAGALVADVRGAGWAGLKSVVGYRTGLDVRRWPREDALAAHRLARTEVAAAGAVRLGHQPLLDTLLHVAFAAAAEQELPVQFHVGYGDPDVDLRTASPLHLRGVLEEPGYRSMPVVLLHACWPYVREGAFLAAVYPSAHLDLSYAVPHLSTQELRTQTRAALAVAPVTKLLCSSDGGRVPELHWLGARTARRVLGEVLGELVDDGDLDAHEAQDAGERLLRGNARALYGFDAA